MGGVLGGGGGDEGCKQDKDGIGVKEIKPRPEW